VVSFGLVVGADVLDFRAVGEAVAILDSAKVAEEIFAAVVRLDEAEAAVVPAAGDSLLFAAAAAATVAPTAAAAAPASAPAMKHTRQSVARADRVG
jgi:hypothetical protein